MKRIISLVLSAALALCCALCGCGKNNNLRREDGDKLRVWVYSGEYKYELEQAIKTDLSGLDFVVEIEVVEAGELDERLAAALESGSGAPDIIMLSPSSIKRYVDSQLTLPLSSLGIELDGGRYYAYTVSAGTDSEGELKAACWQPDPGAFFYRRSIAKAYLGTDSPEDIQAMLGSWEGFYQTAQKLSEQSGEKTDIVAGPDDLQLAYMSKPASPWVVDGKLSVCQTANNFLEYSRKLAQEGLIGNVEMWSPAWAAGISDTQSVFGYFSSAVGMEGVLKAACEGSALGEGSFGDWACCKGPQSFNWGGCWFAVLSTSKKTDEAAIFLEYFVCEEEAMRKNALITGAFSANLTVVESIKYDSQFTDPFLGGQNYYYVLAQAAPDISMDTLTAFDAVINLAFADCAREYAFGFRTLEQATSDFYAVVAEAYPEIAAYNVL